MHNRILNRYYFIKKFDQSHIEKQDNNTIIIFRNYSQAIDEKSILTIKNYCKKKQNKFLISNNKKLAINWPLAWYPCHVKAKNILDEVSSKTKTFKSISADFSFSMVNKEMDINEKNEGTIKY